MTGSTSAPGCRPPAYREPSFGQRLVGALIDAALFLPLAIAFAAVAEGSVGTAAGLVVVALYQIVLVTKRGQTVGKIVMGTQVVDRSSGALPSLLQATKRWATVIAGSLVALAFPAARPVATIWALLVLAPVMRPPLHRGLHDLVAGTIVTSIGDRRAVGDEAPPR